MAAISTWDQGGGLLYIHEKKTIRVGGLQHLHRIRAGGLLYLNGWEHTIRVGWLLYLHGNRIVILGGLLYLHGNTTIKIGGLLYLHGNTIYLHDLPAWEQSHHTIWMGCYTSMEIVGCYTYTGTEPPEKVGCYTVTIREHQQGNWVIWDQRRWAALPTWEQSQFSR